MLTIGSLFSGYGGLDIAVESVINARTAWVSDIDKGACKVLAHRYPNIPNLGDITTIDWSDVEPVDIITGGSPCQDLSTAGRRAGMTDGTRSNLWVAMREAIANVKPTFVIWENVRGALSAPAASDLEPCAGCVGDGSGEPHLRALGRVLGDLDDLGYDTEWRGLRASSVGACHQRFRVFVLAWRRDAAVSLARRGGGHETVEQDGRGSQAGDWSGVLDQPNRDADGVGPDRGSLTLLPTPNASVANDGEGPETWLARQDRIVAEGGISFTMPLTIAVQMLPTPMARDYKDHMIRRAPHRPDDTDSLSRALAHLLPTPRTSDTNGAGEHGSGGLDLRTAVAQLLPTPTAVTRDRTDDQIDHRRLTRPTQGLNLDDVRAKEWGDYAAAVARQEATFGHPAPPPTEPGKNGPRLSARFTEWMMGLPAGWTTDVPGVTRNEALKLAGNGVVPQQASAALRDMLPHALTALRERQDA